MSKNDLRSLLGGSARRLSEATTVFERDNGYSTPMTPLERKMYSVLCSLTNTN